MSWRRCLYYCARDDGVRTEGIPMLWKNAVEVVTVYVVVVAYIVVYAAHFVVIDVVGTSFLV